MATANLDYAEEYGDGTVELQPTSLPLECNFPDGSSSYENVANVRFLFQHGIINWPNFTHCMPNCGLCTQFASDQTYLIYNLIVIGFLLPFISLCGLGGNVLSAFVYSRPSIRQIYSGSIYLSALGCSDTAVIVTALFLFFIDSIRRYSLNLTILYGSLSPIVYPAGMIAQTCSVYFTLIAGIDCFVQVCMPTNVKDLFASRRFTKCTTSVVLVFAFFYNIPHCFESVLLDCWHQNFLSPAVEVCPAPLRFHPTYTLIYYKYMYAIFLAVGPLMLLIALNTVVIIATVICKKGNSADNLALILVVLLFILCNTIALLINIFETHLSAVMSWRINYIIDISNLLVVFNSSFNFVIYYNFSRPFRCTFCHHFGSSPAYQKSPSISSRSSVNKRRAIAGITEADIMPNGITKLATTNGTDLRKEYHQVLLLRNGTGSQRRPTTKMPINSGGINTGIGAGIGHQSAGGSRLSMPLEKRNSGGGGGRTSKEYLLLREEEERSKLLFMDQSGGEDLEEEVDIWERKNGHKYYDEVNGSGQQQQQIWQKRPILKPNDMAKNDDEATARHSRSLYESKIDGNVEEGEENDYDGRRGGGGEVGMKQDGTQTGAPIKSSCSVIAV